MRPHRRHVIVLAALALLLGVVPAAAGTGAGRIGTGGISGTVGDPGAANPCGLPHPSGHLVLVDAFDATTLQRYGPAIADAAGGYTLGGLPVGSYKVRFRVFDPTDQVTYWWYGTTRTSGRATTFGGGDTVTVTPGQDWLLDVCPPTFAGGDFKGIVKPIPDGVDLQCMSVAAYEAVSGIHVGFVSTVHRADGGYRSAYALPPGDYRAVAYQAEAGAACPTASLLLKRWWKGDSGPYDLMAAAPQHWDSGATFTITAGTVRRGVSFTLLPVGTCDGLAPTIIGTTADDVLIGTAGPDVIQMYAGDDEAHGLAGDDTICGGPGADDVWGGNHRDRIFGGDGDDDLRGGGGRDHLDGGKGLDRIFGGPRNDLLLGGGADDTMYGDGGNDRLRGNRGDDTMYGGDGDDRLSGDLGASDFGDGEAGTDVCSASTEIAVSC